MNKSINNNGIWEKILVREAVQRPGRMREVWMGFDAAHIQDPLRRDIWIALDARESDSQVTPLEIAAWTQRPEEDIKREAFPPDANGIGHTDMMAVSERVSADCLLMIAEQEIQSSVMALRDSESRDWQAACMLVAQQADRIKQLAMRTPTPPTRHAEDLGAWLRTLSERVSGDALPALSTGLNSLDDASGRLHPGHLILLAGRPGMGKTFLLLHLAAAAARCGRRCLFASLEMSKAEVIERLSASHANVSLGHLRTGQLTPRECQALEKVMPRQAEWPLDVLAPESMDMDDLAVQIRRCATHASPDLICIDYLQMLRSGKSHEVRNLELERISRSLKSLAREMHCPVIAASQLSRAVERRINRRPMLADLRDSGSLEQDADQIWMLYRHGYYDETADSGATEIHIAKNRHGPEATVHIEFERMTGRFVERHGQKSGQKGLSSSSFTSSSNTSSS